LDLQNLARRTGRPTDELLQTYALEGFLARLAESDYADRLVVKGGVLLAAFGARRPTRDVDLQATALPNELEDIRRVICAYSGARVSVQGRLARASLRFHVDVNIGDPVWPAPEVVDLPLTLGGHVRVLGYPLAMVHAEKLITALERGTANTRWRDFADIYLLSGRHTVAAADLARAMAEVSSYRGIARAPLAPILNGYSDIGQPRWTVWRRRQRLEDRVPEAFGDVLRAVTDFADPILGGARLNGDWDPHRGKWIDDSSSDEPSPAAGAARVQTVAERAGGDAARAQAREHEVGELAAVDGRGRAVEGVVLGDGETVVGQDDVARAG
jgi:hypothetical protein